MSEKIYTLEFTYDEVATIIGWHFLEVNRVGKLEGDTLAVMQKLLDQMEEQLPEDTDD